MKLPGTAKLCAADGCGQPISHGMFICAACWRLVPMDIQRAVWGSWNALRSTGFRGDAKVYLEKLRLYQQHCAAAKLAVSSRLDRANP